MADDPYVHIEGQDYYAEKDIGRDNGILVKESKPVFVAAISEYVELGRDLCQVDSEGFVLPYVLANVMGQEDLYRLGEGGFRELNTQTARIVATTVRPTTILVEYGAVFPNPITGEETWVLDQSFLSPVETGYHDFIIEPVSPDTLYAFRVTVTEVETGTQKISDIHFFRTADFVVIRADIFANVFVEVFSLSKVINTVVSTMLALFIATDPPTELSLIPTEVFVEVETLDHHIEKVINSADLTITASWV